MRFPPQQERDSIFDSLEIQQALRCEMTPRERWQQRVSFAYGNCAESNPNVTREMVEAEAVKLYGPCPE
jgi:hypothetical protein